MKKKLGGLVMQLTASSGKRGVDRFFSELRFFKKQLEIDDKDILELMEESSLYCSLSEWGMAVEPLVWLVFFEPLNSYHFLRLGVVLLILKQYDAALRILEEGFYLDAQNPEFALYIGNCLLGIGDNIAAKNAFNKCVELTGNSFNYEYISELASGGFLYLKGSV